MKLILPYRYDCSIVRFRRWVCAIGGVKNLPKAQPTPTFDILNLDTGRLFKGPEMKKSRCNHSALATDQNVFVFGGECG
ncbi:hypothetical protein ACTXT7_015011, partial [Hymenolepis weldensis]